MVNLVGSYLRRSSKKRKGGVKTNGTPKTQSTSQTKGTPHTKTTSQTVLDSSPGIIFDLQKEYLEQIKTENEADKERKPGLPFIDEDIKSAESQKKRIQISKIYKKKEKKEKRLKKV